MRFDLHTFQFDIDKAGWVGCNTRFEGNIVNLLFNFEVLSPGLFNFQVAGRPNTFIFWNSFQLLQKTKLYID